MPSATTSGPCGCCGGSPPTPGCDCSILIPIGFPPSPYADYSTAKAVVDDPLQVSNCIGYATFGGTPDSLSITFDGTTLEMDGGTAAAGLPGTRTVHFYASVSLLTGSVVSVDYAITTDGSDYQNDVELLYCSDGSSAGSDSDTSATGTLSVVVPSDGEYIIHITSHGAPVSIDATYVTATNGVTVDDIYWVNPVIALWDDSGTTRSLWACPKLLLPPLTEFTGDWYADCAAADAVLTDSLQVSNCVGFLEGPLFFCDSFTATDGGTSLTLAQTFSTPSSNDGTAWGGINAVAGDTLTFTSTTSVGSGFTIHASIYDDTGTLVESLVGGSPQTSSALPYTGRYTVSVYISAGPFDIFSSCSTVITSSGTMSINTIQARYDLGLTCAALLDCGDSCP